MEKLKEAIIEVKNILLPINEPKKIQNSRGVESRVRDNIKTIMGRTDLRLAAEMLIMDIYNNFLGFDRHEVTTKLVIIDDILLKIEKLEMMISSGDVIAEPVVKMPPPPDYVQKEFDKENRRISEEKEKLLAQKRTREEERKIKKENDQEKEREKERELREKSQKQKAERREKDKPQKYAKTRDQKTPSRSKQTPSSGTATSRPESKKENRVQREVRPETKSSSRHDTKIVENEKTLNLPERPITDILGIGSIIANKFKQKSVATIDDLVRFLPRDYEDRRKIVTIKELEPGQWCTAVVKIEKIIVKHPPGRRNGIVVLTVSDSTGKANCKFFGGRVQAIRRSFPIGETVLVSGEVEVYRDMPEFHHPDSQILKSGEKAEGSIVAVYSETEGLGRRRIRSFVRKALDMIKGKYSDTLPQSILQKQKLLPLYDSLEMIHFPESNSDFDMLKIQATEGHKRLVFEELFLLQLGVALRRWNNMNRKGISYSGSRATLKKLIDQISFDLTKAQKRAVNEIVSDMKQPVPMNRLLQGDVGSGKTIVALFAAVAAMQDGYQVAFMVPTEMLARQHLETFTPLMEKLGFGIGLMTGQLPPKEQNSIKKQIEKGKIQLIVGTHSLFQSSMEFAKLGLAIIDEQHRFGVNQRRKLTKKGWGVDILTMTATPIPRTLAMTAYGDMDISIIDEKPKGRKAVSTRVIPSDKKEIAFDRMKTLLSQGKQGFVIYPIVEQTGEKQLLDAVSEAEKLAGEKFKDFKVGLLHGKMKPIEKEQTTHAFIDKKLDLLVATTVVEVGIDIPGASIIIIEHAERFGLAQLHQLRGRVGRSTDQGECFLIAHNTESDSAIERLSALESTNDGMKLAEKDLELRGQGDVLGTKQHGMPPLRIADLTRDFSLLEKAKKEVQSLIKSDPMLDKTPEHKETLLALERWWGELSFHE